MDIMLEEATGEGRVEQEAAKVRGQGLKSQTIRGDQRFQKILRKDNSR